MKFAFFKPAAAPPAGRFRSRVCAFFIGLARDYWKDGGRPEPRRAVNDKSVEQIKKTPDFSNSSRLWHADIVQVKEKIWGAGCVLSSCDILTEKLVAPLGLTATMTVLDLAAGLGSQGRALVADYGCYVDGLEPDARLAERGMAMSVASGKSKHASVEAYDPASFSTEKHYDCVISRELFYRIADKPKFFKAVASCLKSQGQLGFMDYILEPEVKDDEHIKAWLARESGAAPMSTEDMKQEWTKLGFDVRVNQDRTVKYRVGIMQDLARFAGFLAKNPPDAETKPLVAEEIELWALRVAAMDHGLKFCRFHAIKN